MIIGQQNLYQRHSEASWRANGFRQYTSIEEHGRCTRRRLPAGAFGCLKSDLPDLLPKPVLNDLRRQERFALNGTMNGANQFFARILLENVATNSSFERGL